MFRYAVDNKVKEIAQRKQMSSRMIPGAVRNDGFTIVIIFQFRDRRIRSGVKKRKVPSRLGFKEYMMTRGFSIGPVGTNKPMASMGSSRSVLSTT